jgi:hypothetical protein
LINKSAGADHDVRLSTGNLAISAVPFGERALQRGAGAHQGESVAKNPPGGGTAGSQEFSRSANPTENSVQRTRAWSGFWVVFAGDLAIAAAAAFAVWKFARSGGDNTTPVVAILTSAFTAVSTMTTAYFGIKTMSNTAQSFAPIRPQAAPAVQSPPAGSNHGTAGTGGDGTGGAPVAPAASPATRTGAPIPADPANPTNAEIVARMQEPPQPASS